jgi:hypothetical protein
MPGPLVSISQSGKINTRSHARIGRTWQESYRFKYDSTGRGFVAEIQNLYRNGTNFTIQHQLYKTQLGAGGGTPLVDGSTQTGQSIVTDGWPTSGSSEVVKKGDLVTFAGVNTVFDITATSTSKPAPVRGG